MNEHVRTPVGVAPNADSQHVNNRRAQIGKVALIIIAAFAIVMFGIYVTIPIYGLLSAN